MYVLKFQIKKKKNDSNYESIIYYFNYIFSIINLFYLILIFMEYQTSILELLHHVYGYQQ